MLDENEIFMLHENFRTKTESFLQQEKTKSENFLQRENDVSLRQPILKNEDRYSDLGFRKWNHQTC